MDSLVGQTLDMRYAIESVIGRGGMGVVYRARHVLLGEPVAVKILAPERAREPQAAQRFAREAKSAFRLDHPHIVRVTDFGATATGLLYLVMELSEGRTLGEELSATGPIFWPRVMNVAAQVASAMAHAHARGIVHRDLKIDNIMISDRDGEADFVKVLDFGLAKLIDADARTGHTMLSVPSLTAAGTTFGTPEYMSPEQATGSALDGKSDVYSLGVCLYELVSGRLPFWAEPATAILAMHVAEPVPPLAPAMAIPGAVAEVILGCLEKRPENRPTAADLGETCAELAKTRPTTVRVSPEVASSATMDLTGAAHVAAEAAAVGSPPPPETLEVPPRPRGRIVLWGMAAAAIAAMTVAAIHLAKAPRRGIAPGPEPSAGAPLPDAALAVPAPIDAPPPASDAATVAHTKRPSPHHTLRPRASAALRAHLAAAEAARRRGNRLQQLAEADAALRLAPHNRRAAFLVGDALIASGDRRRGCRYLQRALPDNQARTLARARCD